MPIHADDNVRPEADREMQDIADYLLDTDIDSSEAYHTARYVLLDSLGCAMLALRFPECTRFLDFVAAGAAAGTVPVPGTPLRLDPVSATCAIGALIRWLDYNDTWLAAEWGHPSDNLAAILSCADYIGRRKPSAGGSPVTVGTILTAMIKAHEIQGIMALENSFNRVGLDHVVLVKLASAAVTAHLMGGTRDQIINAISQVWVDGQSLRTYRHAPNTGPRKSWAAGDAAARGVRLALMSLAGEPGYPSALSAKGWGFYDAAFRGEPFRLPRSYGAYVMEHTLFKVSFPAEFHAQTAVECAFKLHEQVRDRLEKIHRVMVVTQEPALRIISKKGPLYSPADRDHCLQYMVAVGLIFGELTANHYRDEIADDPRIDPLRARISVVEEKRYTEDYLDPEKRSIANAIQVFFKDGSSTDLVEVEYPIGHRKRRWEAFPLLEQKARENLASRLSPKRTLEVIKLCLDAERLAKMPVQEFMDLFVVQ